MRATVREEVTLPLPPGSAFELITSEEAFLLFRGYGPIPGLRSVEVLEGDLRTVGSTARVTNTDGSTHRERVLEVEPGRRYAIRIHDISSPFGRMVDHIDEIWQLRKVRPGTAVERIFEFDLRSALFFPLSVPLAQILFRMAVRRNHRALVDLAEARGG